jgi:hypothetical protein
MRFFAPHGYFLIARFYRRPPGIHEYICRCRARSVCKLFIEMDRHERVPARACPFVNRVGRAGTICGERVGFVLKEFSGIAASGAAREIDAQAQEEAHAV